MALSVQSFIEFQNIRLWTYFKLCCPEIYTAKKTSEKSKAYCTILVSSVVLKFDQQSLSEGIYLSLQRTNISEIKLTWCFMHSVLRIVSQVIPQGVLFNVLCSLPFSILELFQVNR